MAWYRAISTGVASTLARWEVSTNSGSTWTAASVLPTAADDVYPNGFTVTLDYDIVADKLINRTALGVAAGGSFPIGAANTITADIYGGTVSCVSYNGTAFKTIVGDLFGSITTALAAAVDNTSTGTIYIVGNATGGSVNASMAIYNRSSGVSQVVGDCIGGTSSNAPGLYNGVNPGGGGNCIVARAIASSTHAGVLSLGATITVVTAISHTNVVALRGNTSSIYHVTNAICTGGQMICDVMTRVLMQPNGYFQFPDTASNFTIYNSLASQGQASASDVRSGTSYANGTLTGTAAIPPAASVALNVPVDNTVGSYVLTVDTNAIVSGVTSGLTANLPSVLSQPLAEDLLTEISTSSNPVAERLRNVSTVQTTGSQLTALTIS